MALKSFWGKIRMCDNEWLSTLPLWTEPDQLMFWHPGDFNETWMGCWDRPFPKHFRTACFRCQRGMTMQFVRIPENPGASLHLSDFWTDLQLVGRRWHPKGSFSTIFQMIQWYLGIWFVFTGYIGMWGTPQVGRLYTWVWSHVGMPQDTADRLNYWDAVGWPIDAEVFGFPRVRVGSSDGRQVAVKTDNVHARCEILDLFADWMHRVEPVLLKSKAFVWMFFFSNVHQTMATVEISRAEKRYSTEDLVATQNRRNVGNFWFQEFGSSSTIFSARCHMEISVSSQNIQV